MTPHRPEMFFKIELLMKTYHEWMKDPELLDLTASMSLTLEQEYEMQRACFLKLV